MTEIVRHDHAPLSFSDQMQFSQVISEGDLVPQAYRGKPANALLAIGLGQSMGLTPAESLMRIDVIQGKPTASAELIASNVRRAGHKLRVSTDESTQSVTAQVIRADDPGHTYEVTRDMKWARDMGLASKDNYKKQPLTMLQWRAISAVARLACSEALYGVAYTADEIGDAPAPPTPRESVADVLTPTVQAAPPEDVKALLADGEAAGMSANDVARLAQDVLGRTLRGWQDLTAEDVTTVRDNIPTTENKEN